MRYLAISLTSKPLRVALAVVLLAITMMAASGTSTVTTTAERIDVIVTGGGTAAESLVIDLGGSIEDRYDSFTGFTATVSADAVAVVRDSGLVDSITPDSGLLWSSGASLSADAGWGDATVDLAGWDPKTYSGSMLRVGQVTGAREFWQAGYTGAGIDVAVIDTGVLPVPGLDTPGKIVNGADLSFESQASNLAYLDGYGHGTHMAGIIAGRDAGASQPYVGSSFTHFVGMAPDARIVNVKVGNHDGTVDVSQVIAAIDWVIQHRRDNGLDIRVLNLSFGTDSKQSYLLDPLSFAVEQAWKAGIVAVVAVGNDGNAAALRNPASDPFVIAVGSAQSSVAGDPGMDVISSFSNCGTSSRSVDLVAPGKSILSLRAPGSYSDINNPKAVVQERLFLGSGTSQSAAVVSGAVALLLDQRPHLTPDQVKQMLKDDASLMKKQSTRCQGAGALDLSKMLNDRDPQFRQTFAWSTGLGLLEGSRGTDHLENNGVVLAGEQDIFGQPFNSAIWAPMAAAGSSWSGGEWNGSSWSGSSWSGSSWSTTLWSGSSWSGSSWSGSSWSGAVWTGSSWSGSSWSGSSWSGSSWSGSSWSGLSWDHGKRSIN